MESSTVALETRADEPLASPVHPEEQPSWTARPVVAATLRVAIFLAPIAASVLASFLVARRWPRPEGLIPILGWLGVLIVVGGIAMVAIDRVARRFLPLTALLRMTLIFPDQAPSRFGLAIRSGTTKQLERRLEHVQEFGLGDTEAEAAATLLELAAALREHDRFTRGHGERVRAYAALIGEEMGLDAVEVSKLQWAGLIHDVGKLAVPEEVLNKPGRLTAEEYDLIKTHPAEGMALIGPLTGWLGDWALAVGEHHERWDGGGYPAGLAGTDISLAGRIVAVADTFDVITATRSYKPSQSPQWARRELAANAGTQFDPDVVRAFLNVSLGKLRGVMWPLSWIAHIPFLGSTVTAPATGLAAATIAVVGSSLTGGSLGSEPPQAPDPIERAPTVTVPVDGDTNAQAPSSTVLVVRRPTPAAETGLVTSSGETADPSDGARPDDRVPPGSTAPIVIVVTTTSPDDALPGVPVIVTVPPRPSGATGPDNAATGTTLPGATPTTAVTATTTTPAVPGIVTPTTLTPTDPTVPTLTTLPSTTLPSAPVPPPTTAAPTTLPPTTLAGQTCASARSGATNLSGADLSGCDLSGLTLSGVDLSGADLTDAKLDDAVLLGGSMRGADGTALSAQGVRMENVDLSGADLTDAAFDDGRFIGVSFASARARNVDFSSARFDAVSFANAELHDTTFDQASMVGAQMSGVIARNASFEQVDARGSNWTNADLRGADLSDSDLSGGRIDGADVRGTDFGGTNLRDVVGVPSRTSSAQYSNTICPDGSVQSSTCWP